VYSNGTQYIYTPKGAGIPFTKTSMEDSKRAILTGSKDNEETNHYISFDYESDVKCSEYENWKTKVSVFCEPDGNTDVTDSNFSVEKKSDTCELSISIRHPSGCPVASDRIYFDTVFRNHPYVIALIFIVLGLFSVLFGWMLYHK
jgi:hypothetical protein